MIANLYDSGNKDGSTPESYRCNGHLNRPYNETTFNIKIRKNEQTTSIGKGGGETNGSIISIL